MERHSLTVFIIIAMIIYFKQNKCQLTFKYISYRISYYKCVIILYNPPVLFTREQGEKKVDDKNLCRQTRQCIEMNSEYTNEIGETHLNQLRGAGGSGAGGRDGVHSSTETRKIFIKSVYKMKNRKQVESRKQEEKYSMVVNSHIYSIKNIYIIPHQSIIKLLLFIYNDRFHYLVNRIKNLNKLLCHQLGILKFE